MMKPSQEDFLLEEYKNAYEHIRYVEAKRDRYVPGVVTASGVVLALLANIFASGNQTNGIVLVIIILLCMSLGILSCFLYSAYDSFSTVIWHYENVIGVSRQLIFKDKETEVVKLSGVKKNLINWLNVRQNKSIRQRPVTISKLSLCILRCLSIFWFAVAAVILIFMLCHCWTTCEEFIKCLSIIKIKFSL